MAQWYRNALMKFVNKEADWDSDAITCTLHTSAYTPSLDADAYVSALTNELPTAGGYTVGGVVPGSATRTYTAANSWSTSRANSTAYTVGQIVRPATGNGFLYRCAVAGTSGGSIPTWLTVLGGTTVDGGVSWTLVGSGIIVLTAANAFWSTATFTGVRYAVISDRTPGTAATQPLLGLVDFITDQAGGGGAFNIVWDSVGGILQLLIP
jgi:hypothetical protein